MKWVSVNKKLPEQYSKVLKPVPKRQNGRSCRPWQGQPGMSFTGVYLLVGNTARCRKSFITAGGSHGPDAQK